nr:reverse transcriptase domain-containing protein [Tanacetum cinerariifolium]
MDDEPMWVVDCVIAPTPDFAITFLKPQINSPLKKTVAFVNEGSSNSDTDKIMARMDAMTMKMDAQYKELQSRSNNSTSNYNDDDIPMSREEEAKFMQTFRRTCFYNDYRDCDSNRDNWRSSGRNDYNRDNYRLNSEDKPDLQRQLSEFIKSQQLTNSFVKYTLMDLKTKLETTTKNHQASIQNLEAKFDTFADKQFGRPSGSLPSSTQLNPKGSEILHSIEGTIIEEKLFVEFDEFMAMNIEEDIE